jgi:transposase
MHQTVYRNIAGIDVHKKMLAVVVRCEDTGRYEQRKFGTTRRDIEHLAAWLHHHKTVEVVMESTAQYWRPVWQGLEAHFGLHLCHPLKVKARQGRKSDFRDAQRLADRWHSGDLEESFIPGVEQRDWRALSRTRVQLKRLIVTVRNSVECVLEEGGIKLTSVASDVFGVSGWAILNLLAQGETDVKVLSAQARGALGKKVAALEEALAGKLRPTQRMLLKQQIEQVKLLRQQVQELTDMLAESMKAHTKVLHRLTKIPGVDLAAAQELVAEVGPEAAAFPSAEQFASWVGCCPGSQESAGICYSRRSAKGNRYVRRVLCQVGWAASHTKDTFFAGLFARLKSRIKPKGAAWAVAHRIATVVWLILHEGVEYCEKGPAKPNPRTLTRKLRRLVADLARVGLDARALLSEQQLASAVPKPEPSAGRA